MKVFETLFGKTEYGESVKASAVCDSADLLKMLAGATTVDDVHEIHRQIQLELGGGEDVVKRHAARLDQLRLEGNRLFEAQKFELALDVYKSAIYSPDWPAPGDARFYTNAAVCLINLGRYEEAVAYAKLGRQIDPKSIRGFELTAVAYSHLGQDDIATDHVLAMTGVAPQSYIRQVAEKVREIRETRSAPSRRFDNDDLVSAMKRLISVGNLPMAKDSKEETIFLYLLYQLSLHGKEHFDGSRPLYDAGLMRIFKQIPLVKRLFSPEIDFVKLTLFEAAVIQVIFSLLHVVIPPDTETADLRDQALRDLVTTPNFVEFLCSLGKQMVKREAIQLMARSPVYRYICEGFMGLMIPFDDSPAMRERYVKGKSPLCDPTFAVHMWLASFCTAPSLRIQTPITAVQGGHPFAMCLARLGNLTDECRKWYLDPWRKASKLDLGNVISIASVLGHFMYILVREPNNSFYITPMLFWVVATAEKSIGESCGGQAAFAFFAAYNLPEVIREFKRDPRNQLLQWDVERFNLVLGESTRHLAQLADFWESSPIYAETRGSFLEELVALEQALQPPSRLVPGNPQVAKTVLRTVDEALRALGYASQKFKTDIESLRGTRRGTR